ncbi:MAG: hypothetical protein EXX96DRAFT_587638 [Benjaminiella poitrasii]|nr:MAG: hypothetical protein EXX96DRAFT_587638 [Benjaminiella poitrasii]
MDIAVNDVPLVGDEPVDRFEALPRHNALFLHGVDDMSTQEIEQYVDSPLLVKVEWINDSSCNLSFSTEEDASTIADTLVLKKGSALDHRTLVPAKPYLITSDDHRVVDLFVRVATDEDVKERGARVRSRYYQLHGIDGQELTEERRLARKEHIERMKRNGGDGSDVFSRLGRKVEPQSRRNRSRSPDRNSNRLISTAARRREKVSVEKEIPEHLKSRLGPIKTEIKQDEQNA